MALNFTGLGFSFGAKDDGLQAQMDEYAKGFGTMSERMAAVEKAAAATDVGNFVSPGDVELINSVGDSFDEAAEKVGHWQDQSRHAKGQFQADSSQMESDSRKVGGGINFIGGAMDKLDQLVGQNKLQTFIQSISLARLNDIAGALGDVGSTTNLMTGLESEMHGLGKTAKATGANFGYTGKELKKFSSKAAGMAKGLAIGAGEAAGALRAWDEAGSELAASGLKNAKDVAKFSEAFGVNANVLRNSGLQMRNEFKMSDKEINQVMGSFAKMGQLTGDVGGAMNQMPEVMGLIRRKAAMMGQALDSKELAKYAAGTAALAAGFMQQGQTSDDARASAMALSETMISSQEDFQGLFAGVGSELSGFHEGLAVAFGDIGVSFDSMQKGPQEFISGLTEMVQHAKKAGGLTDQQVNLIRGQLGAAFGPEKAAELVNFFQRADDATLQLMSSVQKAPADLGKMAKEAFVSSKTLGDRFEEAEQRMTMGFRKIGRSAARDFVGDSERAFKRFNKSLSALAARGGPLGAVITKMSEMHQIGVKALLPKTLRPMAALMGNVVKEGTPMVTALGSLGLKAHMLANPFVLATAAVGGFYALQAANKSAILKQNENYGKQTEALGKLEKQLKRRQKAGKDTIAVEEKMKAVGASLAKMRVEAAKEAKIKTVAQIEQGVRDAIVKITTIGGIIVEEMKKWLPKIQEFLGEFWHTLIYGVDPQGGGGSFAQEMGAKLGGAIRTAAIAAYDFVVEYLKTWWQNVTTIWSSDTSFEEKVKATFESSAGIIIGVFSIAAFTPVFGVLGKLIFTLGVPILKAVAGFALSLLQTLIPALASMVTGIVSSVVPAIIGFAGTLISTAVPAIISFATTMWASAVSAIGALFTALVGILAPIAGMALAFIATAIPAVVAFGVALATALWPFTLVAAAVAAVVLLAYTIYDNWGSIKEWFMDTFGGVVDALTVVWKPVGKILMAPIDLIKGAWKFISTVFTDPVKAFKDAWEGIVGWFGDLFDDLVAIPKKAWNEIKDFGKDLKGLAGDTGDLLTGDLVPALMSKAEAKADALATALKQRGKSDTQIQSAIKAAKSSGDLKGFDLSDNNNPFYMKLRKNNFDVQAAIADDTNFWEMQKWRAAEKASNAAEWRAQQLAATQKGLAASTTAVVGAEADNQVSAILASTDKLKEGVDTKTSEIEANVRGKTASLFGILSGDFGSGFDNLMAKIKAGAEKAKAFVEENAPAKSIVIGEKSIAQIGPQAKQAFGKAGAAMDKFGGKFGNRFEMTGKKSISAIAEKAFNRIKKAAITLRDTMKNVWTDILTRMGAAFDAINKDTRKLIGQMRTIASASQGLMASRGAVSGEPAAAPKKSFKEAGSSQEAVYNAIHRPDWYYDDFRQQVLIQTQLLTAISAGGGSIPQGGRSETGALAGTIGKKLKALEQYVANGRAEQGAGMGTD